MKKTWFTLVEILIVIVLFGLLGGLILQTYTTISRVAFRLHQEKEIAKEALMLSQVLENLAQTTTIDYDRYLNEKIDLPQSNGLTNVLYLRNASGEQYALQTIGECMAAKAFYDEQTRSPESLQNIQKSDWSSESPCQLQLITQKGDATSETVSVLLDSQHFDLLQFRFRVIPFASNEQLRDLWENAKTDQVLEALPQGGQPAFWIFGGLYSKYYHPHKWSNAIALPIQYFISLQGSTPTLYSLSTTDADL